VPLTPDPRPRCGWARSGPDIAYHDREWGVPVRADRRLFEFLVLEGAQAGLSWSTILARRRGYRAAFAAFDPAKVARFTKADVKRLLRDPGIIRHRGKIEGTVANARAFLAVQREHGSFAQYLWGFVNGRPIQNCWRRSRQVPAETAASQTLSRDLKRRGFTFVGPTICYAFMQATGLVNDHLTSCFRHAEVTRLAAPAGREIAARGRSSLRSGRTGS
jgi:DNA-3-methyladenine glycosylase I